MKHVWTAHGHKSGPAHTILQKITVPVICFLHLPHASKGFFSSLIVLENVLEKSIGTSCAFGMKHLLSGFVSFSLAAQTNLTP